MRNLARVSTCSGDDHLWLVFIGKLRHLVKVDQVIVFTNAVVHEVVKYSGRVEMHPVGQVPAMSQIQTKHRVSRFERREVDRLIRLRTGMWLNIGKLRAEKFFGPIAGNVFNHIGKLATTIIATAGIALGVLVGEHATDRFHHGRTGIIFAGNQLQPVLLTRRLILDGLPDFVVLFLEKTSHDGSCLLELES